VRNEKGIIRQPIRFQGQYHDEETGLYYNRWRFYDPLQGRYVTQDPIGLLGGVNSFAYPTNPVGWVDPLGLVIQLDSAATPAEIADYNTSVAYLKKSSTMAKIIDELTASSTVYTVKFGEPAPGFGSAYNSGNKTIYWMKDQAVQCTAKDGTLKPNQTISPALALGHEMAHANKSWFDRFLRWLLPDSLFGDYSNYEEWRVITGPENKAAGDLGEGVRTGHYGSVYTVTSPIRR
jgi:RHS repeat-associated protein